MLREVRQVRDKRCRDEVAFRQKFNAKSRDPSLAAVQPGDLVLERESGSKIHRHNNKGKVDHD